MLDVLGLGAHAVDQVYRLPAAPDFHGLHSKLRVSRHTVSCGGQVATALSTCAAFGLPAAYLGPLGTDDNAARVRAELDGHGVDLSHALVRPGGSQYAVILIDDHSGERVVLWDRPPSLTLAASDLPVLTPHSARAVLVDDVDAEASAELARRASAVGLPVVTDLDHLTPHTEAIIRAASPPILSEHLPMALTHEPTLERALRALRAWTPGIITVTLGREGALSLVGDDLVHEPGVQVTPVDTTGSGDVFRGAFLAGLLRGFDIRRTLRLANRVAAASCTRPGAMGGVPTRDEARRWLAEA